MRLQPWQEGLVVWQDSGGALMCQHDRPLANCGDCAPEAERRMAAYHSKHGEETDHDAPDG